MQARSDEELIQGMDAWNSRICAAQRELFRFIAEADRREAWKDIGARDMAHWLWMRYNISDWKARRWIAAANALERLPLISSAFAAGELGIDAVVELTRLARPETEANLIGWAKGVSSGAIRHRADLAVRRAREEAEDVDTARCVHWWYFDEGRRFGLAAELPAAQGAVVARALERLADDLPAMPDEDDPFFAPARWADALVALCSARVAEDADPDRATVVVHTSLDALVPGGSGSEVDGEGVVHPETVRRLLCDGRVQAVIEDAGGVPVRLGRITRDPPPWMLRQLRHRDRECRFPGCGSRRFLHAHHIVWWERGGHTDLGNLVLICSFHHKLVHEYGWRLRRDADGAALWFLPSGAVYRAGPGPPGDSTESLALSAAGF